MGELDAKLDLVLAQLAAQKAQLDRIERQVRSIRVPRDHADAALLEGLLALNDAGTFRASAVIAHGELVSEFKQLLVDSDIETILDCGYWLRRFRGHVIHGRRLESTDRDSDGAVWCFLPE